MSPGGDYEAYKKVEPYLKEWAAKAKDGSPCVEWVGPRGAGHYVKMVHNGIEQGQLSILAEAWSLLHRTLQLPNEEIKDILNDWNAQGELSDDFLVDLGAHILTFNVWNEALISILSGNDEAYICVYPLARRALVRKTKKVSWTPSMILSSKM